VSRYPAPESLIFAAFVILLKSICPECRNRGFVQGIGIDEEVWSAPCPWCDGAGVDEEDLERFCRPSPAAPEVRHSRRP
jgi:hypothetical protein